MTYRTIKLLFLFLANAFFVASVQAQVTIGSTEEPRGGALLDLKETNDLSTKGLLLPRVDLMHPNFLYPMFDVGDPNYSTAEEIKKQNEMHKGLVVYNTNECFNLSGKDKGVFLWIGNAWINVNQITSESKYFQDSRDGKAYAYKEFVDASTGVSAGEWMLENLAFDPTAKIYPEYPSYLFENKQDGSVPSKKYFYYPQNSADKTSPESTWVKQFGYMYNYSAAMNIGNESGFANLQGVCPTGWHIPSTDEWKKLIEVIAANPLEHSTAAAVVPPTSSDANGFYGTIVGAAIKSVCQVPGITTNANGKSFSVSEGGFSAFLLGYNAGQLGVDYGETAMFHTSNSISNTAHQIVKIQLNDVATIPTGSAIWANSKDSQMPIRCVRDPESDFELLCNSGFAQGVYRKDLALDASNYIEIDVQVTSPGRWEASTNTIDNISFSGSGTFPTAGTHTIKLQGKGTPTTYAIKPMIVSLRSEITSSTCKVDVRMILPARTVLGMGTGSWAIDYSGGKGLSTFFSDPRNFGPNGRFKSDDITLIKNINSTDITVNLLKPYIEGTATGLNGKPVDIMIATYNSNFGTDEVADYIIEYIKQGGVFVLFNEHMSYGGNETAVRILQRLYPQGDGSGKKVNAVANYDGTGGFVYRVPGASDDNDTKDLPDDTILNRPFGNVRGAYIGEDQGWVDPVIRMPKEEMDWWIPTVEHSGRAGGSKTGVIHNEPGEPNYTIPLNTNFKEGVFAFKAKNYNLFYCGDGGVASAVDGNTSSTSYPFVLNANNYPIAKNNYGVGDNKKAVQNSVWVGNIIAWAVEQSVFNGINTD